MVGGDLVVGGGAAGGDFDQPLAKGEGGDVEFAVEAREKIELRIFECALGDFDARRLFFGSTFGDTDALAVALRDARVLDLHAGTAVHEQHEHAANVAFYGEGPDRTEEKSEDQPQEGDS